MTPLSTSPREPMADDNDETPKHAGDELIPLLYSELRKLARARLARWNPSDTLQPTALVNEAYLRLMRKGEDPGWQSKAHFFGAAARAMRDILVEQARRKAAVKHGGDMVRVDMNVTFADGYSTGSAEELLTLHQVLEEMQDAHPRKHEMVLLRYFGGLTMEQIADVMDTPLRTLEREWRFARAWLRSRLSAN